MNRVKIPKNRLRKLKTFTLGQKPYELQGVNPKQVKNNFIDLCSNDYFGLSRDNDVIKASYEISLSEGLGSGSSRFITGSRPIHKLLETQLAEWLNQEKVLLFPSGFQANIAAVQGLEYSNDPSWNLMEIGMSTKANLFISPIQDILSLDDSSRLNTPGTITKNWRWKLNQTLDEIDMNLKKYSDLGNNYGRLSN